MYRNRPHVCENRLEQEMGNASLTKLDSLTFPIKLFNSSNFRDYRQQRQSTIIIIIINLCAVVPMLDTIEVTSTKLINAYLVSFVGQSKLSIMTMFVRKISLSILLRIFNLMLQQIY